MSVKTISVSKKELFFVVLYKVLLDIIYIKIQAPLFAYNGFSYEFNIGRIFLGWFIALLLYFLIYSNESSIVTLFSYTIFLVSILPFVTLFQYNEVTKLWMLVSQCILLVFIRCIQSERVHFLGFANIKGINYKNKSLRFFVAAIMIVYFLMTLYRFGIPNLKSLLFSEVYDTRTAVSLSTMESIIQNAVCRIVCPLSLLVCFKEKKWISFTLLALIQVYTYAATGFKTYLFIPIVLIGLQFFRRIDLKRTIVIGLPVLLFLVFLFYSLTHNTMLYAVLVNRPFFLPARIKYCYFDYFSSHEFIFFSQNTISKLLGIKSNYSVNVMNLIGAEYFNKPNMWTNTGFMADAYANLGFAGMALIGCIIAIVISIINRQLKYVPQDISKEIQALFIPFFISLNDGAAISVLFSGGLLFAVLCVCFVKFRERL